MARQVVGWIKLHRKILADHSWVGYDGVALAVFVTLLLEANYADGHDPLHQGVFLKRGQVATSPGELADRLKFARSTIQRKLDRMYREKMLGHQAGYHGTIITVVNYDKYQDFEGDGGLDGGPEVGYQRATSGHIRRITEQQDKEELSVTPPFLPRAPARVDPNDGGGGLEEARLVAVRTMTKALGAYPRSEDEARRLVGAVGTALIHTRYESFAAFWDDYTIRRRSSPAGMVDAQVRDMFVAILTDPEWSAAAALKESGGETSDNAH